LGKQQSASAKVERSYVLRLKIYVNNNSNNNKKKKKKRRRRRRRKQIIMTEMCTFLDSFLYLYRVNHHRT
jgi:hypothetical protein